MNKIISIEKMSTLSRIDKISINIYSIILKNHTDEQFVKYKIKYSIPDYTPILTKSHMYTQFVTDIQNNNYEITINHNNDINLKFNTQLLKHWLKKDTVIVIEIEAIKEENKNSRLKSKIKNFILWKGIANVKCRDLICLPNLKLKSYIPIYKESNKKISAEKLYIADIYLCMQLQEKSLESNKVNTNIDNDENAYNNYTDKYEINEESLISKIINIIKKTELKSNIIENNLKELSNNDNINLSNSNGDNSSIENEQTSKYIDNNN
ncbi:hypothetical protein BCR36DRAFT_333297, partial [Piromyces finnis]